MWEYPIYGFSALFLTAVGLVYWNQRKMIYVPGFPEGSKLQVYTPNQYGMPLYEDLTLKTPDGVNIKAYFIKQEQQTRTRSPTLLYLHANAGNMGHRLPIAQMFYQQFKCNIMMLSYRGYGLSEGEADEKGMQIDAQAALDYLLVQKGIAPQQIMVFGQSIGGAVAIDLVSKNTNKVAGLILENTFTSMRKLIPFVVPLFSAFTFLCTEKWESDQKIGKITVPILFLSGTRDELIPPAMMKELFSLAVNSREKEFQEIPGGTHNDTCVKKGYFEAVIEFWKKVFRTSSSL